MPQFDFEYKILRHAATNAIADSFEWTLCQSSFRGTGTQGTNQPYTKMLGQNFGAGITSRELYQDAILMRSPYRQKCLWPALIAKCNEQILRVTSAIMNSFPQSVSPSEANWETKKRHFSLLWKISPRSGSIYEHKKFNGHEGKQSTPDQ